jgi:hypothetical protein
MDVLAAILVAYRNRGAASNADRARSGRRRAGLF